WRPALLPAPLLPVAVAPPTSMPEPPACAGVPFWLPAWPEAAPRRGRAASARPALASRPTPAVTLPFPPPTPSLPVQGSPDGPSASAHTPSPDPANRSLRSGSSAAATRLTPPLLATASAAPPTLPGSRPPCAWRPCPPPARAARCCGHARPWPHATPTV